MAKIIVEWPHWFHGPDGQSAIFNSFNEVPAGWVKVRPPIFKPTEPVQVDEDIRTKLTDLGVTIDPRWGKAQMLKVLNDRSTPR